MNQTKRVWLSAALLGGVALAPAGAAETTTYTGSGTFSSEEEMMPLANGSSVVSATMRGVAAISTSPPGLLAVKCTGMGMLKPDDDYGMVFYCSFTDRMTPRDGFDAKGVEGPDGTTVEIVGGSGRWAGATGEGKVNRGASHATGGSFSYEFSIATP